MDTGLVVELAMRKQYGHFVRNRVSCVTKPYLKRRGLRRIDMRILQIAHAFPPTVGGVESHLWEISCRLAGRGHTVLCLVGGDASEPSDAEIAVLRTPEITVQSLLKSRRTFGRWEINRALQAELRRICARAVAHFAPDVIHVHNAHHFAPELARALFQVAQRICTVNSVHDRVGEHLFQEVLNLPWNWILYASKYLQTSLSHGDNPSTVLWLGIDSHKFVPHGATDSRMGKSCRCGPSAPLGCSARTGPAAHEVDASCASDSCSLYRITLVA